MKIYYVQRLTDESPQIIQSFLHESDAYKFIDSADSSDELEVEEGVLVESLGEKFEWFVYTARRSEVDKIIVSNDKTRIEYWYSFQGPQEDPHVFGTGTYLSVSSKSPMAAVSEFHKILDRGWGK